MKLTRGELGALACYAVVIIGFMPPVVMLANRVEPRVFGMPFLLFWIGLMVLVTSLSMTLAFWIVDRSDRR